MRFDSCCARAQLLISKNAVEVLRTRVEHLLLVVLRQRTESTNKKGQQVNVVEMFLLPGTSSTRSIL